jgi:hypothetical protein
MENFARHFGYDHSSKLEFRGAGQRLLLTIDEFEVWMRSYYIMDLVWRALDPDKAARSAEVVGIIEVHALQSPLLDIVTIPVV